MWERQRWNSTHLSHKRLRREMGSAFGSGAEPAPELVLAAQESGRWRVKELGRWQWKW